MPWSADFNLGEYLGIGLDTRQIAHLAGALFLGLFSLSALRHAKRAQGVWPAVWIAVAIGLLGGTLLVAARGFPDELPEFLKPWTDPDRLARAAAILALLGCAIVLLSAHWVRSATGKLLHRVAGLAVVGVAVWLAAGWFGAHVPDEIRPWTADTIIVRGVVVLALGCFSVALWTRGQWSSAHARWANRALSPLPLAFAVLLAARWFVRPAWPEISWVEFEQIELTATALACGTCLVIAGGAYFLRDRPLPNPKPASAGVNSKPTATRPSQPALPVATLLDDRGQPLLPRSSGRAGPAGA